MADLPPPPPTPPAYAELARRVDTLEASAAQGKRAEARANFVEDRSAGRFEKVLGRLWDLEQQRKIDHELLRAIAAKLGVTP